jgi:hypothetical protein
VSGARNNLYLVTPPKSDIRSIKDLKDRNVSIFRGTNGHLVAINVLAANGLAERDVKGVNLDVGSAQAALVSNGVDAAFGGYEWFKVRDQGLAKVVYSTQGQGPGLHAPGVAAGAQRFRAGQPGRGAARGRRVRARGALVVGREEPRRAVPHLGAQRHAGGVVGGGVRAATAGVRNSPLVDDFIVGRYKAVVADALKLKLIRREVSVDDWFDTRYLKNALKKQGLENYWTAFDAKGQSRRRPANRSPPDERVASPVWPPLALGAGEGSSLPQARASAACPHPSPLPGEGAIPMSAEAELSRPATSATAPTRAPLPWRRIRRAGDRALPWLLPIALLALWFTRRRAGLDLAAGAAAAAVRLGNPARPGHQRRPLAAREHQFHARRRGLRGRHAARPGARFGHGPVAQRRGLRAAHLQCAGADPGAGLAALRAADRGHRRAAEIHPHRQGGAGAGGAEHAAGLPPDPGHAARGGRRSTATAGASRCWRSCCRTPCPRSSPACGWASPRPGCRWWWWSWWRRAKGWATSSSTAASCSSSTW